MTETADIENAMAPLEHETDHTMETEDSAPSPPARPRLERTSTFRATAEEPKDGAPAPPARPRLERTSTFRETANRRHTAPPRVEAAATRPRPTLERSGSRSGKSFRGSSAALRRIGTSFRHAPQSLKVKLDPSFGIARGEVPDAVRLKHELLLVLATSLHPAVVWNAAVSAAVTALVTYRFDPEGDWVRFFNASKSAVVVLSALLSFSLVFRTNICYSRWWEGRCLWGQLIYAVIHAAQQGHSWIKDDGMRERFQKTAVVCAWACKAQLREHNLQDDQEEGRGLVERGVLNERELTEIAHQPGWQPYYCLDVMRSVFTAAMGDAGERRLGSDVSASIALQSMEETLRDIATALGGLIRVKSTGLPTTYDSFFAVFACIFFLMASFAWSPSMGWYTPPVIAIVSLIFILIKKIGDFLEDPFGMDLSDLPLQKYCKIIEMQVNAIKQRDMGYLCEGPGGCYV